ncbi:MAG: threonylcarbamoyl-AMP synthase [Muribaculaceae bacterium]|nr:threonylcarbamoyl-AMP synthase [Muribaculaceae bacterium]
MSILKFYDGSVNTRHIDVMVEVLRRGEMVIYPTDSLYALGCDALNQKAIERLCRLKGLNPDKNLLSIVCADISQAADYARIDNRAFRILKQYLPGPYTFILPASTRLPKVFKGRKTVGVRIPGNEVATALASALGSPLLTASVNPPAEDPDSITDPDALALAYHNDVAVVADAGLCHAEPSTIVDITDSASPLIIRQGIGLFEE